MRLRHALRGAHSGGKVCRAVGPLGRQIGIQLEGAPCDSRFILRARGYRELEAPFTNVAPGTHSIRIDINTRISGALYRAPYGVWRERVSFLPDPRRERPV